MPVNMERRGLVALGLLWLGGVRVFAAADVTGIWSAAVRSQGGLGAQMAFTATEATSTFGALIDHQYEIDGTKIKMTAGPNSPPASSLIGLEFTIDADTLTIKPAGGPAMVMTRVGTSHRDAHPIVGDWTYMHQTGVAAVQRFGRKGNAQLSVPIETIRGPYRIEGETMHIQFEGRPAITLTVKQEGHVLTTRDAKGKQIQFVKFEY
jgi:hypothetical protein